MTVQPDIRDGRLMVSDAPGWGTDLNGEAVIARPWKDNIPLCLKAVVGTTRVGHFDFEPSPSVHHHLPVRKALGWESATIALWKPEGDRNSCARSQQGPDPVSTCTTSTCSPVIYSAGTIGEASST